MLSPQCDRWDPRSRGEGRARGITAKVTVMLLSGVFTVAFGLEKHFCIRFPYFTLRMILEGRQEGGVVTHKWAHGPTRWVIEAAPDSRLMIPNRCGVFPLPWGCSFPSLPPPKGQLSCFLSEEHLFIWNVVVQVCVSVYTCSKGLRNSKFIYIDLLWIYGTDEIYKGYFHRQFLWFFNKYFV